MPSAVTEPVAEVVSDESKISESRTNRMWIALKAHVLRERARKQQQREAEVEEERQRRERERQDVMTLSETKTQITELETRLSELKEEKHQLFKQLKKVLHEDDSRRRQLVKENDMLSAPVPQMIPGPMHPQLFLSSPSGQPQNLQSGQTTPYKNQIQAGKRGRSPSPPQQIPVTYAQQQSTTYATYKTPQQLKTQQQPQYQPQKDETRRPPEFVRAVLWNKPSQYTNQPQASFYAITPTDRTPIVYYPTGGIGTRNSDSVAPRGPPGLYETYSLPPGARPPPQSSTHVTVRGGAIPISPAQSMSKTGSITTGYPVRSQPVAQYQQQNGMYTSGGLPQNRQLYSTPPGATLAGYPPPRD